MTSRTPGLEGLEKFNDQKIIVRDVAQGVQWCHLTTKLTASKEISYVHLTPMKIRMLTLNVFRLKYPYSRLPRDDILHPK